MNILQIFSRPVTRRCLFPALFVIGASALGCGGSGNNSDNNEGTAPLATTTRLLQPGDTWVYKVTFADGRASATETHRVEDRSADGNLTYRITSKVGSTESIVEQMLSQPDAASPLYLERETRAIAYGTQTLSYPARYGILFGTWQNDAVLSNDAFTSSYTTTNTDGTTTSTGTIIDKLQLAASVGPRQYRIVGTETVTTPAGRFATWKVTYSGSTSIDRGGYQHTAWYAPQIGNFVKWEARSSNLQTNVSFKVYDMILDTTTVTVP